MRLYVNQKEYHTYSESLTVAELVKEINIHTAGIAVAVNNKAVRKVNWTTTPLAEGDKITVITAVCGG